jgi:hypothetical protein
VRPNAPDVTRMHTSASKLDGSPPNHRPLGRMD